jgi:DNA-binding MurR/RpiR family transcriptional regulator
MGFRSVLEYSRAELTASEQRIASILLGDPQDCILLSAAQLAERASVHESTVIRFAQKLGYSGYPELHADVVADARQVGEAATQRLMQAAEDHELASIVQQQLRVLADLPRQVRQESLDSAVTALLEARRVYIYGQDLARFLVEFMERKLRRLGFDVVAMPYGGTDLAEHLVSLSSDDVLLAFAFGQQRRDINGLLRRVQLRGAKSILVTDALGVTLRPAPTHLLAAPRSLNHRGHLAPLLICYALEYAIVHFAPERVSAALERLSELTRAGGGDDEIEAEHLNYTGASSLGNGTRRRKYERKKRA